MTNFTWSSYPKTQGDFEELMKAIDAKLASSGLKPFQRPMHVGRKLWEALGWSGSSFPDKRLADEAGYEGEVLMAKAYRWYEDTYGNKLKGDFAYGFAPARLGNALWRVRAGLVYGTVQFFVDRNLENRGVPIAGGLNAGPATFNILCAVEGLPQGLVNMLTGEMLREHFDFHVLMHVALQWREELPKTELFGMARQDYDECTSSVLAGRYGQARWAAEQAVEKTLKGLLSIGKTEYPKGGKNGHSLEHASQLLKNHHGITLSSAVLALAECSPAVRYGEEASSEEQALRANHAVLAVLDELRRSKSAQALLSTYQKA